MKIPNAKQDIQNLLSCFSKAFSRPSFKIFSSFILGFIQLGKEPHTSSMVHSLSSPFLQRSLCSFTRFLGQNAWAVEEVVETALEEFFHLLRITTHSVLFLLIDDTMAPKSGKKIPGCTWHKDHTQKNYLFGHQWVLSALLYKDFLLPLRANLYHPKGTKGCGPFKTKITMAKKILQSLRLPIPCKVYLLVDSWYWSKELALYCRKRGYHMISQLKSTSVLWIEGKKTKVTALSALHEFYRELSLCVYGKTKILKVVRFVGVIPALGKVAVVVVKEKGKKDCYLVSTNLHLSALDIVKYYAKRWKIEQMIKDLKQRLGFGHYQLRTLQAIQRHVALSLLSYGVLILLKILQWLREKTLSLDTSIRLLAFQMRRHILVKHITVALSRMKISFNQSFLDIYLEKLWG